MCVLGRPFGLRQLARNGKHVVLMRDMTETMYNPRRWPYVSHFEGTRRVISHIERYVCPTITSDQWIGGVPFRFAGDRKESENGSNRTNHETPANHWRAVTIDATVDRQELRQKGPERPHSLRCIVQFPYDGLTPAGRNRICNNHFPTRQMHDSGSTVSAESRRWYDFPVHVARWW